MRRNGSVDGAVMGLLSGKVHPWPRVGFREAVADAGEGLLDLVPGDGLLEVAVDAGLADPAAVDDRDVAGEGEDRQVAGARVGAERGVVRSADIGKSWVRINDDQHRYGGSPEVLTGDPDVRDFRLAIDGGRLAVGYLAAPDADVDELRVDLAERIAAAVGVAPATLVAMAADAPAAELTGAPGQLTPRVVVRDSRHGLG